MNAKIELVITFGKVRALGLKNRSELFLTLLFQLENKRGIIIVRVSSAEYKEKLVLKAVVFFFYKMLSSNMSCLLHFRNTLC